MKPKSSLLWVAVLCAWGAGAHAQQPATSTTTVVTTTGAGETPAQAKLVSSFTAFAGSEENARSLVTGLRQGSEITLTPRATGGTPGGTNTATTFTPQTRPMGNGNVRIALSLAREQLAREGITQPTPAQIQAVLVGSPPNGAGTSTPTQPGILQMRADGMGWGQIANGMGIQLGHDMSGRTTTVSTSAGTSSAAVRTGGGITTAAGTAAVTSRGNSAAAHAAHGSKAGIVTAAGGGSVATGLGAGARGGGNAAAAGVVTAAGSSSNGQAAAQGRGLAKGHANP